MKKALLLFVAAGAILVSCSGGLEKEAAKEFCDCYSELAKAKEDIANSESSRDLLGSMTELKELAMKANECQKKMDEKYEGKLDLDAFKEEVKKVDEAVYKMAEEQGVF